MTALYHIVIMFTLVLRNLAEFVILFYLNMFFVNNETLVQLYKMNARPYLDYVIVVYSPQCLYLINTVKSVQRHFTKTS